MPALLQARSLQKRIRVWCAAASTGQEPYSLAMGFKEMGASLAGWRIEILATDISAEVLEKAKSGVYSQFEVQRGLPIQLLIKYFTQVGDCWQLSPEIKAMVQFRPFNLLNDFAPLGMFDLVFCRNVLIYFDQESKVAVLDRLARQIDPTAIWCLAPPRLWSDSPSGSGRIPIVAASICQTASRRAPPRRGSRPRAACVSTRLTPVLTKRNGVGRGLMSASRPIAARKRTCREVRVGPTPTWSTEPAPCAKRY